MKRLAIVLLALPLLATKPCPPAPCSIAPHWTFDAATCDAKADWIAVGHIKDLRHHWQGMPLNKDFASFTFVVERWMKGGTGLPREIPFQVGWCENRESVSGDGAGQFKFWVRNKPDLPNAEWEFLHIEAVTSIPPAPSSPSADAAHSAGARHRE